MHSLLVRHRNTIPTLHPGIPREEMLGDDIAYEGKYYYFRIFLMISLPDKRTVRYVRK